MNFLFFKRVKCDNDDDDGDQQQQQKTSYELEILEYLSRIKKKNFLKCVHSPCVCVCYVYSHSHPKFIHNEFVDDANLHSNEYTFSLLGSF